MEIEIKLSRSGNCVLRIKDVDTRGVLTIDILDDDNEVIEVSLSREEQFSLLMALQSKIHRPNA